MASVSREPNGRKTVQFVGPDRKRRSLRLGKVPAKTAYEWKTRVEHLLAATHGNHAPDAETAAWVGGLGDVMHAKLVGVGLVALRESPGESGAQSVTLASFVEDYIAARPNMKPNTLKNYRATQRRLVHYFGNDRLLTDITPGCCDEWHIHQVGLGLASATVGRTVKRARQFFRAAVRKRLILDNPMQEVKAASQVNKSREHFVARDVTQQVIDACPDAEWRLIVALSRYGGLRCPSEHLALCWGDVDWERSRIRVRSPKTEHHVGGESRLIPMFPELRPYLEEVFDQADPGTEHVVTRYRESNANLRTQLLRIINRAGVEPWPKLFQNLRASRETELCEQYPMHVVCAWLGNSQQVAAKHYLQVTDEHFQRASQGGAESGAQAVQNPVQPAAATVRHKCQETQKAPVNQGLWPALATAGDTGQEYIVPPRGVEPLSQD